MDPAPDDPATLGRYRVQSRLGAGGMGRVLLGVDEDGRRAALKIVHAELAADPGFRERFRREVQMAASAPPWFTAPVLDADPDAERPWLATEFVEGPSLQSYVTGQGPLTEQGVTALAVRMADGLVALHAAGLVHRDLKPSNVLLADDGPRLIDFGISRAADTTSLTQTGHVMGTPEYMSPEQAGGARDIGPASDMFSFGSLVVFAATGRSPFAADSAAGSLYRIVYSEPDLGPLAGRVREAVQACLTKDPAGRPAASQVRGLLRAADAENQVEAEPTEVLPATPSLVKAGMVGPNATLPAGLPAVGAPQAPPPIGSPPIGSPAPGPPPNGRPPAAARPRWLVPVAVLVAALLGAGITFGVMALRNAGTPSAGGPTSAPSTPGSAASPTADPTAGVAVIDAETDGRFGTGGARFASPTRNIACAMTADQVRCDVAETAWQLPPKPADCSADFGKGAVLAGTGGGLLSCVSDTVADPALPVLPYDQGVRFAGVVCVSKQTGLRCENTATGHGFRVARASYDLF
jgi:eukaryotic-like serine/threonine-protein kinase